MMSAGQHMSRTLNEYLGDYKSVVLLFIHVNCAP